MSGLALNEQVKARLVAAIRAGNTHRDAAGMAGVSESAFRKWLERGRRGEEPFSALVVEIERAAAEHRASMQSAIVAAARGFRADPETGELQPIVRIDHEGVPHEEGPDWRAAMAWLEKRDWKTYDQRAVVGHIQAQAQRDANLSQLSDQQILTHLKEIVRGKARKDPSFVDFLRGLVEEFGHDRADADDESFAGGD